MDLRKLSLLDRAVQLTLDVTLVIDVSFDNVLDVTLDETRSDDYAGCRVV